MYEDEKVVALGSAYVEGKILSSKLHLPRRFQLHSFLDAHPEAQLYTGGSIPNILTSFVRISGNPNVKLLTCIGNDPRGWFYLENMDRRLRKPQITTRRPTDIWVGIYDQGLVESIDRYGAITDLSITKGELDSFRPEIFITDFDVCRFPIIRDQVKQIVERIDDGLFILSLVGANTRGNIHKALSFTDRNPDIVFGNASELSSISGELDSHQAIKIAFPESKLLVVTQAEKGSLVRLGGQVFSVPAVVLPKDRIIDKTGAGDSFMGTMLASLLPINYRDWRENHIIHAAKVASYAATLVIQSMHSRLTPSMVRSVQDYESNL